MNNHRLTLNDYQDKTGETAIYPGHDGPTWPNAQALSYLGLGLGEAGEVQGKLKKLARDGTLGHIPVEFLTDRERTEIAAGIGTRLDRTEIAQELGDLLWYVAQLAGVLGFSLADVAQGNLDKLASRKARDVLGGSGDAR